MATSDSVAALAMSLAHDGGGPATAVEELRASSMGNRVAVVMAKRKLASAEPSDDNTNAIALLDMTLTTSTWT